MIGKNHRVLFWMKPGYVRIIAGKWRGRKLKVLSLNDLRPTPDRVKETLFNWLMPFICEANCLDLFTGSGALGLEALSRGAAYVEMVDVSQKVVELLRVELAQFKANNAVVYQARIPEGLRRPKQPFDIVFIDPPYKENLLLPCCHFLAEQKGYLADNAYIYLEAKERIIDDDLPHGWRIIKHKQAGYVFYHLAFRECRKK